MKVLRRKSSVPLDERLAALGTAAGLAEGRLSETAVERARAVVRQAGKRAELSVEHTVAALAGATGSGKSSLFNAISGTDLAAVGVTRPTTSDAQAARWDPEGSGPLLDWLDVPRRHTVNSGDGSELSGLVLIDLPDHDSIETAHRLEVDRLVAVVDLLVWVLDPQKYADAAVHERYLRPLSRHRDVMVVVLNQVDRLPERAVARCLDDLRGLLEADGLSGVPVVPVSARTGEGLPELRDLLAERVARRQAWAARLAADAGTAADELAAAADLTASTQADAGPGRTLERLGEPLTAALSRAAGVPVVVDAVAKAHRHRAVVATGWPVTRWVRRFRPDPLRRLRLDGGGTKGRTSLPVVSPVQRSEMDVAVREVGAGAAEGVPEPWARAVREAARAHNDQLADALDQAVASTSLGAARRPRWWTVVGVLQWLVFAALVAGALWLAALFVVSYLRLPDLPTPEIGEVPWPTALLLGGALAGIVIALLSRAAAWLAGRRRARKAAKALRAAVSDVGTRLVLAPAETERARFTDFTAAIAKARAG
ncbi:YfjP family GTPase [Actinomadura fulvescens]|uniref:50S ribosome-binding GTPase n=1 Tax=Actinomadura fulvescens TaxID=46160 RepID=A0ABP6C787_9ACTN